MARFEQFEVWEFKDSRWQFLASFPEFDLAQGMAQKHTHRVRVLQVVYNEGKAVEQQVLTDIGAMRDKP